MSIGEAWAYRRGTTRRYRRIWASTSTADSLARRALFAWAFARAAHPLRRRRAEPGIEPQPRDATPARSQRAEQVERSEARLGHHHDVWRDGPLRHTGSHRQPQQHARCCSWPPRVHGRHAARLGTRWWSEVPLACRTQHAQHVVCPPCARRAPAGRRHPAAARRVVRYAGPNSPAARFSCRRSRSAYEPARFASACHRAEMADVRLRRATVAVGSTAARKVECHRHAAMSVPPRRGPRATCAGAGGRSRSAFRCHRPGL